MFCDKDFQISRCVVLKSIKKSNQKTLVRNIYGKNNFLIGQDGMLANELQLPLTLYYANVRIF